MVNFVVLCGIAMTKPVEMIDFDGGSQLTLFFVHLVIG